MAKDTKNTKVQTRKRPQAIIAPRNVDAETVRQAAALSVQTRAQPNNVLQYGPYDSFAYFNLFERVRRVTDVPPYATLYGTPYGQYSRDRALRRLWTQHGAEPVVGAISATVQKVQSTDWILEGPEDIARDVHYLLHNSDYGQGWEEFLARTIIDYLTQDNGMFIEVIGGGDPAGPLEGPVLGIAHIDANRCTRTGDIEYPVVYRALEGGLHKLHTTRVISQADLPNPDERRRGVGFCALSRAVASAQSLINWSEMRNELIDDMPPSGLLTLSGINRAAFNEQYRKYMDERRSMDEEVHKGLLMLFNVGQEIKTNLIPFRQTWEGFTQKDLYEVLIDLVAMAFNIDRQELAPLVARSLGSGAQSTVLSQKSRGKGIGNILNLFERIINRLTPEAVTFRFKFQDDEQEKLQTEIKQMKANYISTLYVAGQKPLASHTIGEIPQSKPSISTSPEGLIDKREARYMMVKEGLLPRELLTPEEMLDPNFAVFDDITSKAVKRYGKVIEMRRDGQIYVPLHYEWPQARAVLRV